MSKLFFSTLLALFFGMMAASAQFEGVIEMKTSVSDPTGASRGGGTQKIFLSDAGSRMEMDMQMAQMGGMKMIMLIKNATPDVMYKLNEGSKTYTEIDLAKAREMAAQTKGQSQYAVEKLGEEKILGYKTQHVRVTNLKRPDEKMEMWISNDFGNADRLAKMQAAQGRDGLGKALKEANVAGMPMKSVINGNGANVIMEVVNVDKKSLPPATFEIPEGYSKSAGGIMDDLGAMTEPKADDARKQLQEAVKNMTPEQRAAMEKMMKQMKPGGQ